MDEIAELHRKLRGYMLEVRELKRDLAIEAREHPLWPVARRLFDGWRLMCRHPNARWSPDRFWIVEPFLALPRYAPDLQARVVLCTRAIAGARHDCWSVTRRNGTKRRFDEWERVYGSAGAFEEFCNKAPRGWAPVLSPGMVQAIADAEATLARLKP